MLLNFFGNGAGFADEHTSAYFTTPNNEMVIIDCPMSTFFKLKKMDLSSYDKIYVCITHTHGDHISGLGLFAQYAYFVLKKTIVIVAPSKDVAEDIKTILTIEGNEPDWYEIITAADLEFHEWYVDCILTKHSPQLENKCFGYRFQVNGTDVVYTGDTSTLEPFLPLTDGCELYVDTSVYYGMIHLKLEDALDDLIALTHRYITVYLMHLDDVAAAEKIVADISNVNVVPVTAGLRQSIFSRWLRALLNLLHKVF